MATSFADLKKSGGTSSLEKLNQQLEKLNPTKVVRREDEDTFWYPSVDKAGNGEAIIRFLPEPAGESAPFVRILHHSFKGPAGQWFIENSPKTIGKDDPVREYASRLWDSGDEESIKIAKQLKMKTTFISNVYVIKDKLNPENEGKVFRFRFGKKIFEKVNALINPEFEGDEPVNPFDLWNGADFRIRIRHVDGYRNYDASRFDSPAPLFKDDAKLEEVWKQTHPLSTLVAESEFKSYDDLKARLNRVLVAETSIKSSEASMVKEQKAPSKTVASKSNTVVEDDDEDSLIDFKKLVLED